MSLNWNLSRIKDWQRVCYEFSDEVVDAGDAYWSNIADLSADSDLRKWAAEHKPTAKSVRQSPVTNSLIWTTIGIDLGSFTVKNIDEVCVRVEAWQDAMGALLRGPKGEDIRITSEQVREHIGLGTNVAATTRKQWEKRLGAIIVREAASRVAYRKAEAERLVKEAEAAQQGDKVCRVCDGPRSAKRGGCTNGCCQSCHERFCTPGGNTETGHGLDVQAARALLSIAPTTKGGAA